MAESKKQKSTLTYSKFSLDTVRRRFGITVSMDPVFSDIKEAAPPQIS